MNRRTLMIAGAASVFPSSACAQAARAYALDVKRDAGCGCCHGWMVTMQRTGRFTPTIADDPNRRAWAIAQGVPEDLLSCHTGQVEGFLIEGHVPADDVLRLLRDRPRGVIGLAVPDMPIGSPGMEIPSGARDAYEVFAFKRDGSREVFASHEGVSPS